MGTLWGSRTAGLQKNRILSRGNGCYCVRSLKYLCKNEMTLAKIHVAKREMIKEKSRSGKENPFMKRILMEKTIPAMRVSQPHPVRGLEIWDLSVAIVSIFYGDKLCFFPVFIRLIEWKAGSGYFYRDVLAIKEEVPVRVAFCQ